jgi:arylsulfatase A-like enzyme
VPLIVVGPGIPAGTTVDRPVSQVNLPATLLALSGGDGTSFGGMPLNLAWSKSQDVLWPDPVSELAQLPTDPKAPNYYSALQSIVTPEWQMIVGGKKGRELYRWRDDRLEVHDLASAAGNESIASRLVDALQRAERGDLAASASADSEDEKANPVTPRKKAPVRDKNADRERNNEYLKALGYIPN